MIGPAGFMRAPNTHEGKKESLMVECVGCRYKHFESERIKIPNKKYNKAEFPVYDLVCPNCKHKNCYILDSEGKRKK